MIRYSLTCNADHAFESWFRDSVAYDEQSACNSISCPMCGSQQIAKAVMAPAVVGARATGTVRATNPVALVNEKDTETRRLLRGVRDRLYAEGHDVGARFASEARRIHEGEAPPRQIYGQASMDEARELLNEGIMVLPIPTFPDELN